MHSGHSEFYLTVLGISIRYVNAHLMSLILGGHAHESIYSFRLCCRFSLPIGVCIDAYFSCLRDDWQLQSTNYTFATVYKGRHTKEMSVIDEPAHVAVRLQLLETSSITTPNQTISMFEQGTIFKELFLRKNIGGFYQSATMKKFSAVICV